MQKALRFLAAFFQLFVEELYCVLSNFCIRYFSKMKRKPVKCFPIDL